MPIAARARPTGTCETLLDTTCMGAAPGAAANPAGAETCGAGGVLITIFCGGTWMFTSGC
jgi:hypothetical protein